MAIDNKLITCGIFLDFLKAFDTVNHNILLSKLYAYEIRGIPYNWFESYLHQRAQYVKIEDTRSSMDTIICGIPQGSTLGPLLFLLYINDLPNSSSKFSFRIFADDTNMFFSSNSSSELESVVNNELQLVLKYCASNKLSVNFKKTNYMLISSTRKSVHINVDNIARKPFVKYLGIYIDEHLNWEPQTLHINSKLAKNIGILYKVRNYVDLDVLKQLYYTLIYPYLNYGIMSWGNACKTRLKRLQTKQNQCIRCIFFANKRENAKIYYALLEVLELNNIYKMKIGLFAHKIQNDKNSIPAVFSGALTPASEIHCHYTRYASRKNFYGINTSTRYGQSTFQFSASKIWESVSVSLKSLPYNSFKKHYKQYLLTTQNN